MEKYQVLLYYHYTPIEDVDEFREQHHLLCLQLGLSGRIIIAPEGLNGTVSGTHEACQKYMDAVKLDPRFRGIDFKSDESNMPAFRKLNVRVKAEIVHSSLRHLKPFEKTGVHLSPQDFKSLKDQEDVVILDVRSNYEHNIGRFKNAITFDIENFRDFPEKLNEIDHLKGKKIVTYCTGGIKCEKASAYLLEQGFENVYQLHGGIIKYGIETDGEDFEGKCYVFDNRLTVDINKKNPTVISRCFICDTEGERMVNCANPKCNAHVAICEKCGWEMNGACSNECKDHPEIRAYDGTGYYAKQSNGYNPYHHVLRPKKNEA